VLVVRSPAEVLLQVFGDFVRVAEVIVAEVEGEEELEAEGIRVVEEEVDGSSCPSIERVYVTN
jgi:hypothetical protein